MTLDPAEVGQRLCDALAGAGVEMVLESAVSERPLLMRATVSEETIALRVFLWRITHGGSSRASDEYRVQTTRPGQQPLLEQVSGRETLLLGYDEERDVFAAWNVRMHPDPGGSSSLQVPLELLEEAASRGFASRSRPIAAGDELVLAYRPESIDIYLDVAKRLQQADLTTGTPAVQAATAGQEPLTASLPQETERRREIRQIATLVRDRRFRTHVIDAYAGLCAFCGLGLQIVEAAHIQPVADGGSDVVGNGLAACPTHHAAFDRGLVVITDDLSVVVNAGLAYSRGIADKDLAQLRSGLKDRISVPARDDLGPDAELLSDHRARWSTQI